MRFGEPVAAGARAVVEWWAVVRVDGDEQTIAGASVLRFGEDGRCVAQRDYWALEQGRREASPGFGR